MTQINPKNTAWIKIVMIFLVFPLCFLFLMCLLAAWIPSYNHHTQQQSIEFDHAFIENVLEQKTRTDHHLNQETIIKTTALISIEAHFRYSKKYTLETSWNALGQRMKQEFSTSDLQDLLIKTLQDKGIMSSNPSRIKLEFKNPSCNQCSQPITAILSWKNIKYNDQQ